MNAVFAQLNKGLNVTAGLKKVPKSDMTHKLPDMRAFPLSPGNQTSDSTAKSKLVGIPDLKDAKLQLEGTRWVVENFQDNPSIEIPDIELNQSVYIYNCKRSNIIIKGKFNAISIGWSPSMKY